ncbi:MAG TPA: ADP-ribosylglycohydrolase family protein [Candidatus Limnocylindrales bacterium]|nr:ADP-ribosylglycohydrolase family protein [Candidatus Limnocylindrales bacterium]
MSVDRAEAVLAGLAIGDALGWPVEFKSLPEIKAAYGPNGILELPDPALFTDDTQMTVALAEGILDAGVNTDIDTLMEAVGQRFARWHERQSEPKYARAPGVASMAGSARFASGVPWRTSGGEDAKGCGAAMRVAALGYLYQHDPARLKEVAAASAVITHRHPTAVASAVGAAFAVKFALDGLPVGELVHRVDDATRGLSDEFSNTLLQIGHVGGWADEEAAMRHIGAGWVGDQAVALALYCVVRYTDDYAACIRRGANLTGDSDSVASIAGGIVAARLGMAAIPVAWRARIEEREALLDLAARMAAARG